jgi:glyoxylase-like metal-dependent hydrolase (beta-lactamase superfamily II)
MPERTSIDYRVISIGCLDAHPLWDERSPVRSGHSTTTLVRAGDAVILVDPGLPATIIEARLAERANLKPSDITHVFLTSFRPDVRRGLELFADARWLISAAEREGMGVPLASQLARAIDSKEMELRQALERDVALLKRCRSAPDTLAPGISLFPLPGVTPGLCGLLLSQPTTTVLICGDAIPTLEHLEQGKTVRWAADIEQARASFTEAIEIADVLILGRDNLVLNPVKRPF